jgi:CDGSH-type Zn-finger protein
MTEPGEIIIAELNLRCLAAGTVELMPISDGPLLIRGATRLIDDQGTEHEVQRPVIAICRCGASTRAPWCDGLHKLIKARDRAHAEPAA